jgi:small conductance mechanosensitive channel
VLAVRPYCNNEHYWQVYFDTNRLIRDTFARAGFPVPEQHYAVRGPEDLRLAKTA